MSIFLFLAVILVVATVIALVLPLLRSDEASVVTNESVLAAEFATRRAELVRDRDNGLIDAAAYEAAELELKRLILQRSDGTAPQPKLSRGLKHSVLSVFVALVLPVGVVSLYLYLGEIAMLDASRLAQSEEQQHQFSTADLQRAVTQLQERLSGNPQDQQAWQLLAQSQLALNAPDQALRTLRQALEAMPDNDDMKLVLVRFLVQSQEGALAGEAGQIIESLLPGNQTDPEVVFLAGAAAWQRGDGKLAVVRWEEFLALPDIEADKRELVASLIARAKADTAISIAVSVSVDESLTNDLSGEETVFVFARQQELTGGPPLAAQRLRVADLPTRVSLVPGALMGVEVPQGIALVISARISRSGQPVPVSGDLQGQAPAVAGQSGEVTVLIDTRVE